MKNTDNVCRYRYRQRLSVPIPIPTPTNMKYEQFSICICCACQKSVKKSHVDMKKSVPIPSPFDRKKVCRHFKHFLESVFLCFVPKIQVFGMCRYFWVKDEQMCRYYVRTLARKKRNFVSVITKKILTQHLFCFSI